MRKRIQIAAIVLLVFLTATAAVAVQLYRQGRNQYNAAYKRTAEELDRNKSRDALRNASEALQHLQIYAVNYALTGRPESLKAYRESLEDWQYESGTLKLLSPDDRSAALVRDLSQTGNQLAAEMDAVVSLYDAGSHDAALDRLRRSAAMAYRDKIDRTKDAAQKALNLAGGSRAYNALEAPHRLIYCAGGLYVLGLLGLGLLLFFLRKPNVGDARTRSDAVPD